MKLSLYIKKYLLNDIILLLVLAGLFYLVADVRHEKNELDDDTTVELVPLKIDANDEIS